MIDDVLWSALAVVTATLVVVSKTTTRVARFGDVAEWATFRWWSRWVLILGWAWLGWHLFAR